MDGKRLKQVAIVVAACSFLYYVCSLPLRHMDYIYHAMVWNLFLAVLPLLFALLCNACSGPGVLEKVSFVLFAVLWFVFFPNSPYLITDFIHIADGDAGSAFFQTDLSDWVKLVFIGGGVFLGTAAGMLSLYIIHRLLRKRKGPVLSCLLIGIICLASGYAIYIGRFLRYNSWDLLKPRILLQHLKQDFNLFSLQYSALFACYTLLCYFVFYFLYHRDESRKRQY